MVLSAPKSLNIFARAEDSPVSHRKGRQPDPGPARRPGRPWSRLADRRAISLGGRLCGGGSADRNRRARHGGTAACGAARRWPAGSPRGSSVVQVGTEPAKRVCNGRGEGPASRLSTWPCRTRPRPLGALGVSRASGPAAYSLTSGQARRSQFVSSVGAKASAPSGCRGHPAAAEEDCSLLLFQKSLQLLGQLIFGVSRASGGHRPCTHSTERPPAVHPLDGAVAAAARVGWKTASA